MACGLPEEPLRGGQGGLQFGRCGRPVPDRRGRGVRREKCVREEFYDSGFVIAQDLFIKEIMTLALKVKDLMRRPG